MRPSPNYFGLLFSISKVFTVFSITNVLSFTPMHDKGQLVLAVINKSYQTKSAESELQRLAATAETEGPLSDTLSGC